MKQKIIIVGVMNDTNTGDEVIADSFAYIMEENENYENRYCRIDDGYKSGGRGISNLFDVSVWGGETEVVYLDLYGRRIRCEDNTTKKKTDHLCMSRDCTFIEKIGIKICGFIGWRLGFSGIGRHMLWYINSNNFVRLKKHYTQVINGASAIIFAGGGIIECSTNHDYYHHIDLLTKIADKRNIPVYFNAVGRVVDSKHMFGWNIMRRALNRQCVKSVSCRDGVEWINSNLLKRGNKAYSMPCCAVYAKEAYHVSNYPDSNIIGIGVIRGNIFTSYGKDFSEENLLQLYQDIINGLCGQGWRCCIFTNGYSEDIQFARKLYSRVKCKEVLMKEAPLNAKELVTTISQFKGMVTARLHSCIVAYSLQIPTVAITWTNKVSDFMTLIGKPELAIEIDELDAGIILQRFSKALSEDYDTSIYNNIRKMVVTEIEKIKNDIGRKY